MKKIIAVFLSILMLGSLCVPVVTVAAVPKCTCSNTPIVYVYGKHEHFFRNDDGSFVLDENGNRIESTDRPIDVEAMAKDLVPKFVKAFFTDDWDSYGNDLYENYLHPIYEGIGVDNEGNIIDPVHIGNDDRNILCTYQGKTHGYNMGFNNFFNYDFRKSPIEVAAELNDFIEQVKARTGHDKVDIAVRCQGANIMMAWLHYYQENAPIPFESVEDIIFLGGTFDGVDYVEAGFSGQLDPEPDALYRYLCLSDVAGTIGGTAGEVIAQMIDIMEETYGLDLTVKMLLKAFEKLKHTALAPTLRDFYGTCGTILACVKDNFYESIDFLFPTPELKEEYKIIINKATEVYENVTSRSEEILLSARDNGVKVGFIAEYGVQVLPLSREGSYISDKLVSVKNQTIGVNTTKVDGAFSDKYIEAKTKEGLDKYISPDKQVDTSDSPFRDTTWVVKNVNHEFPEVLNAMALAFLRTDLTIDSDPKYPPFLNYFKTDNGYGRIAPMEEHNANDIEWGTASGVEKGQATITAIKTFIEFIQKLVLYLVNEITALVAAVKQ